MAPLDRKLRRNVNFHHRGKSWHSEVDVPDTDWHFEGRRKPARRQTVEVCGKSSGGVEILQCLSDVPSPSRRRDGGNHYPPGSWQTSKEAEAMDDGHAAPVSSYREQLRATGQQALQRLRDNNGIGKATHSTTSSKSPVSTPKAALSPLPSSAACVTPVPPGASVMATQPIFPTAPAAAGNASFCQTRHDVQSPHINLRNSGTIPSSQVLAWESLQGPSLWSAPTTPMNHAVQDAPQSPTQQRCDLILPMAKSPSRNASSANLLAIAMPSAMNLALDREEIAAQLRAAAPCHYED